jgi:hypothetical protein
MLKLPFVMNEIKLPPDDDQDAICFIKSGIDIFRSLLPQLLPRILICLICSGGIGVLTASCIRKDFSKTGILCHLLPSVMFCYYGSKHKIRGLILCPPIFLHQIWKLNSNPVNRCLFYVVDIWVVDFLENLDKLCSISMRQRCH